MRSSKKSPSSVSIILGNSRAPFVSRVCVVETRFIGALIGSVVLSTGSERTTGKTIGFFTIGLRDKVHVDFSTKARQSARGKRDKVHVDNLNYPQGLSTNTMRFLTGGGLLPSISPVLSAVNRAAG